MLRNGSWIWDSAEPWDSRWTAQELFTGLLWNFYSKIAKVSKQGQERMINIQNNSHYFHHMCSGYRKSPPSQFLTFWNGNAYCAIACWKYAICFWLFRGLPLRCLWRDSGPLNSVETEGLMGTFDVGIKVFASLYGFNPMGARDWNVVVWIRIGSNTWMLVF